MTNYVSDPSTIKFTLTWGVAHPGQNFTGIDRARFELDFGTIKSRAGYTEVVNNITYSLTTDEVDFLRGYAVGPLLPASFTLRTSRTSPDEPQPVV